MTSLHLVYVYVYLVYVYLVYGYVYLVYVYVYLVYVLDDILGEEPLCTSRPFATYWKMLFVTVPLESSINMPMLMRMQWKRFFSTLREG